ncbi:22K [Bat mastadenovirus WIV13]|uniref:22K n=1 Tax=Bat mastadenovirus WIV13 TaxID=1788435 RepID=A0A1B0UHZ3_9ADEN|nr:22K [Bat mastadenovirus WIV13]AMB43036.1 22K [Bat mastadenovirus WIV13]
MPCKTGKNLTNYQTIQQLSETMETPESDPETSQASLEEGEIPESPPIPAPPAVSKKKSRWDIKHTVPSGKKAYKSWRVHKAKILDCLHNSKGNLRFTRRYMLMHNGVLVPANVIHYYATSYYRSQESNTQSR